MRRSLAFAVAISVFAATGARAEPLRAGARMPEIRLMDQHDVEATIGTNVRYVLVTRDMDSGDLVKEALAENGGATLESARAVYVSDISRMPGVVTKFFALPAMRKRGSGHIINVSSVAGRVAFSGTSAYTESKFALEAFSESLAQEIRGYGVKVALVELASSIPPWPPRTYPSSTRTV